MSRFSRWGGELYTGKRSIDFVGRRWLWYAISAVIVVGAAIGLQVKPLDFSIEFVGGAQFKVTLPAEQVTQDNADRLGETVAGTGIDAAASPITSTSGEGAIDVQTLPLTSAESRQIVEAIATEFGVDPQQDINQSEVGPSWGETVAKRSLVGLAVFLVLVALLIAVYFREWKMSVAALVALIHDLIITIGIYAWSGFEVSPATVTGVLTILGFSLYDTVVVFDKVRENTNERRKTHRTYAEAANLAVNQTLVRSINTSVVALLPVGAILYVSVVQLGSGSLKDLALALFVGMAAGTYSSIFVATPLLAHLKGMEKPVQESDRRAKARKKHQADRYAAVPSFAEDMPVYDDPDAARAGRGAVAAGTLLEDDLDDDLDGEDDDERPSRSQPAMGKGRVAPQPRGEVRQSGSAGRAQPSRESRSKRGKK
jgi:preprotein translocase subunit SecF